uniref:Retrovirus-related Pol polyprotein from transposon TNT 1-94 n=1 Tax=Cannabis sativa TaxID=3483 RepID=A0A803QF44_CANSA
MLGHVISCLTSFDLWITLERLYRTSSKARILQLHLQLQSLKKGSLSIHDYILKMKNITYGLFAAGQLLSDDDLILYILGGLDHEYEAMVFNLTSKHDQFTLQEVQYMMHSQEIRMEQLHSISNDYSIPATHLATKNHISLTIGKHTTQTSHLVATPTTLVAMVEAEDVQTITDLSGNSAIDQVI